MSRSTKQPTPWRTRLGQFEWKASPYLYIAPFFLLFAVVGLFPLLFHRIYRNAPIQHPDR